MLAGGTDAVATAVVAVAAAAAGVVRLLSALLVPSILKSCPSRVQSSTGRYLDRDALPVGLLAAAAASSA
jgi:hypothetical protein